MNPVSPGLVKFLNPHQGFIGQTPVVDVTERLNVKAREVTLNALAPGRQVGLIEPAVTIVNPRNYGGLTSTQASLMSQANGRDVVGVSYGLYRYLGQPQANVDLKLEDFANTSRWQKLNSHFSTGPDPLATVQRAVVTGNRVRVETSEEDYGIYEYLGTTATINLNAENYRDGSRWRLLLGAFATDGAAANLGNGTLVTNKFVIDALTIRKTEDINVDALLAYEPWDTRMWFSSRLQT